MKVKKDYITRQVAGEYLLIPVGEAARNTRGLINLTESGYLLFQKLQNDCTEEDLVNALLEEYDASQAQVEQDVRAFLAQMRRLDMLEE